MAIKKIISGLLVILCSMPVSAGMSNSIEYTQLYIVGSAVEAGWNIGATPMNRIGHGVFTWTGKLNAGEPFKFMNSTDGWHKHIVATTGDEVINIGEIHHLNFYANWTLPGELDNKFKVNETAEYVLTVDLRNMSITLSEPQPGPGQPEKYYVTGSALDNQVIELSKIDNFEFKQTLNCKPGNLILMDTPVKGDDTRFFVPMFEDVDVSFGDGSQMPLHVTDNADSRGWSVSVAGDYNVYISCENNSYMGRKYRPRKYLYLVGGCCERSWNYSDPSNCVFRPNPANPDELVWQGELRRGWEKDTEPDLFKILTEQDWSSETYHPYIPDTPAEGTVNIRTTAGDDSKWAIAKDGQYKMTVNTKLETLTVEYLSPAGDQPVVETLEAVGDVRLSFANGRVELFSATEPVDISVVSTDGKTIAHKAGMTGGVVADNLASGIYLIVVKGESVNKTYKFSTLRR